MVKLNLSIRCAVLLMTSLLAQSVNAQATEDELLSDMSTARCPKQFFELPLYPKARLCQIFADQLPATLTYHADSDIEQAKLFYQNALGNAENEKMLKGRLVLQYRGSNSIIVISEDGDGSQVDILVKAHAEKPQPE